MAEQGPLHVKYRPTNLDDFSGNKETLASLKAVLNKPAESRPHTFLLTGPRGCGKTSLGRCIAKFLGCGKRDFIELNTASTRGIDTAREVISQCHYAPVSGPVRVYLFDECHQLTGPGMEALLKITEEVPSHVYFILSTTNPGKLTPTLRSRCSQYHMKPLTRREIVQLLIQVATDEGSTQAWIDYFASVFLEIAKASEGCPRDALVLLDQVIDLDKEQAARHIKDRTIITGDPQIDLICQSILGPDSWESLVPELKKVDGDWENIRRAVLGYFTAMLLNTGRLEVAKAMYHFTSPFYDSDRAGFILACYRAKVQK